MSEGTILKGTEVRVRASGAVSCSENVEGYLVLVVNSKQTLRASIRSRRTDRGCDAVALRRRREREDCGAGVCAGHGRDGPLYYKRQERKHRSA